MGAAQGTRMLEAVKEAVQEHLGQWDPENAREIDAVLNGLPGVFREFNAVLQHMAERLQEESDVDPAVRDAIGDAAADLEGTADGFENVYSTHRIVHAEQLGRVEEPRPGSEKWDVTRNQE